MPLLSINVPAFIREIVPGDLQKTIEAINGYNLHISIACIDYNPANERLIEQLVSQLELVLQNVMLEQILLEHPQMIHSNYYGFPVKQSSNQQLEYVFNNVKKVVEELQQQFGTEEIQIRNWSPYQAHLTLYGQITNAPSCLVM